MGFKNDHLDRLISDGPMGSLHQAVDRRKYICKVYETGELDQEARAGI